MRHLSIALLFALSLVCIADGFTAPVRAQSATLVDAGVGSGSTAISSPTTTPIDPVTNPTGYITELEQAKASTTGWPLVVLIGVFGLAEVLAAAGTKAKAANASSPFARLAWLGKGRISIGIGAVVAIASSAIHALATGSTWNAVAFAAIASALLYAHPAGTDPAKA